ncbi:MAG TPA: hypothetical protein VGD91_02545 [Trebonia sp.]
MTVRPSAVSWAPWQALVPVDGRVKTGRLPATRSSPGRTVSSVRTAGAWPWA